MGLQGRGRTSGGQGGQRRGGFASCITAIAPFDITQIDIDFILQ
jgi:hypothetical protein